MREAFSQHLISMAQNDGVPVEVPFLLLRLLVEISLRITWALGTKRRHQTAQNVESRTHLGAARMGRARRHSLSHGLYAIASESKGILHTCSFPCKLY